MDGKAERHFEQILTRARQSFKAVEIKQYDISETRSILYVTAKHGDKQIAVTEILTPDERRYAYYLLRGNLVLIGLDNARDRAALRQKYGRDFAKHILERVPHLHTDNKQRVELTEERTFEDFCKMIVEFQG